MRSLEHHEVVTLKGRQYLNTEVDTSRGRQYLNPEVDTVDVDKPNLNSSQTKALWPLGYFIGVGRCAIRGRECLSTYDSRPYLVELVSVDLNIVYQKNCQLFFVIFQDRSKSKKETKKQSLKQISYCTFAFSNLNSVPHFWTQSKLKHQVPWDMTKFY